MAIKLNENPILGTITAPEASGRSVGSGQPHTALQTLELLELILLRVDMQTLLVHCQRVCHLWRRLIIGSPALQKKLYFLPDFNIAPKRRWKSRYLPDVPDSDLTEAQRQWRGIQNELLYDTKRFYRWFRPSLKFYLPMYGEKERPTGSYERTRPWAHPNSSWRRMLVQNRPPITMLAKWTILSHWNPHREGVEVLEWSCPPGDGLRMGQFYDWGFRHGYRDEADPDRGSLRLYWASPVGSFWEAVKIEDRCSAASEKLEAKCRVADTAGLVMYKTVNVWRGPNEKHSSESGGILDTPTCWEDEVKLLETGRCRIGDDVWE